MSHESFRSSIKANPYESPHRPSDMRGAGDEPQAGAEVGILVDLLVVSGFCLASGFAVTFLQRHRSMEVWLESAVLLVGVPLVVGALLKPHTRFLQIVTWIFLLGCPIIFYVMTELNVVPTKYKVIRDAICLVTGTLVLLVSSSAAVASLHARQWGRACLSAFGLFAGAGAVLIMTWLFVFFE